MVQYAIMPPNQLPPYDPREIEPKWQRRWLESGQNEAREDPARPKYYVLEMLPYASGDLHVGHARNYTLGDVIGRFCRMRGFNVMHPIGWDAFGLPAENAAIERGVHPRDWTEDNIANMRRQLQKLGVAYDWTREIDSSAPEYYRWTQWLFLLMHRKGLAYKKEAPVNWCPQCLTILANEQAEGGVCWRCGSKVEQRLVNQWFLRITAYADKLLEGLDRLPGWPERTKTMQRNWIGKSAGATFAFEVEGLAERIEVFTTRLDTVYGATFVALAAEHPLVEQIVAGKAQEGEVGAFVERVKNLSELERMQLVEKAGVFSGAYALHPLTRARVPIWVTNYIVAAYGEGAVMGVPAHDQRDLEFARKYGLDVKTVIAPAGQNDFVVDADLAYLEDGVLADSGEFTGMASAEAREVIVRRLAQAGIGRPAVHYKFRDWLISRQRYWGAPIPMVNCPTDGRVQVPEDQLPVLLPDEAPITGQQGSPLEHVPSFMQTICPKCGGPATREPETLDTFADSCWYFLRYLSPHEDRAPWSDSAVRYWAPVDQYIGGAEHAVMHLLYSRFFYKVLAEEGLVPGDEPFLRLFHQGMLLGEDHEKMSKSRPKFVVPIDDAADQYGIDAMRVFEMFAAPPEADLPWSTTGIAGATRMLNRVWRLVLTHGRPGQARRDGVTPAELALRYSVHSKIKQITEELEQRMHVNTSVAALMTLLNDLEAFAAESRAPERSPAFAEGLSALLLMLAPFAPHLSEELWERIGGKGSIHDQPWPVYHEQALRRDLVPVVIQVNGKRRGVVEIEPGSDENAVFARAGELPTVRAQLDGKSVVKRVFVPDKLLNIVVR